VSRRKQKRRSRWRRLLLVVLLVPVATAAAALAVWEMLFLRIAALRDSKDVRTLEVPADRGDTRRLVLGPASPYWTPLGAISETLKVAVIKAEDDRFYEHDGFDWREIRASLQTNLERGRYARGASTITMQLARNLFLWREKSLARKGLEVYLTWRLERTLPKGRILELYLNVVEWGPGVYGIGEASRHYFDKHPSELSLGESAMLAAILPNPIGWNPRRAPDVALRRQQDLLGRLHREQALNALAP
jgi:monofunctional glycosyltransferase